MLAPFDVPSLVEICKVILSNAGFYPSDIEVTGKRVITIKAKGESEDEFINAYQAMTLATPLHYGVEVYDGKKFAITEHNRAVIRVVYRGVDA